jgi:cyclohexanecarboxylate-CoA ligase/acyl-CoA synthetase
VNGSSHAAEEARFRAAGWWRDETLAGWVGRHARETPQRTAVLTSRGSVAYADLWGRARRLACGLRQAGVQRGDVVAAQLPNGVEFIVGYLATGLCGAIFQTLHMPYRGAEVGPLLRHSGARAVIAMASAQDFSAAAMMLELRAGLPRLAHVVAVGASVAGALDFAALADTPDDGSADLARAEDLFVLLYTSGTTAAPKGVPVTYQRFLSNARLSAIELELTPASVLLSAAPFTHLYGLFSINLAFAAGASIALLPAFSPPALAEAIDAFRPTALFTAPAHVAACRDAGLLTRERLASLGFIMISGSACPPELALQTERAMPAGKVLQLWGMSELQAGSYTRPQDSLEVRSSSVGRASPGTELRIVETEGIEAGATGAVGELQVRGCSLFAGYLANDEANAAAFTADGWFRTGDLATIDEAGNVRLVGRAKELINRGGVKFNPVDVEAVLDRHPAIVQSAIVPMPDPVLGERACCFVVLKPGATFTLEDARAWLDRQAIGKIRWPERVEVIEAMPLTPTRKIMKGELVKRLQAKAA